MRRLARFVCAALCAALLAALCLSSYAAGSASLDRLGTLGIFRLNDSGKSSDNPNRNVTRAELFKTVCLIRNGGQKAMSEVYADVARYSAFSDADKISESDLPYVGYCVANGLAVADADGRLRPYEYATYNDCFIVLLRLLGYPVYYTLPANFSSSDAWKSGLDDICRREGLIIGQRPDSDKAVNLGQLADMLCAALDKNTYSYDILQSSITSAVPTGVLLQTKCYGKVETENEIIIGVQGDGYLLESGLTVKASSPALKWIGYQISYSVSEKSGFLSTVMLPLHGQTVYEFPVKEFAIITLPIYNTVTAMLGSTSLVYTLPAGVSATILCRPYGSNDTSRFSYSDMTTLILNARKDNYNSYVRVIVGTDGMLQYVNFYD